MLPLEGGSVVSAGGCRGVGVVDPEAPRGHVSWRRSVAGGRGGEEAGVLGVVSDGMEEGEVAVAAVLETGLQSKFTGESRSLGDQKRSHSEMTEGVEGLDGAVASSERLRLVAEGLGDGLGDTGAEGSILVAIFVADVGHGARGETAEGEVLVILLTAELFGQNAREQGGKDVVKDGLDAGSAIECEGAEDGDDTFERAR